MNALHKYIELKPFLGNCTDIPVENIPLILNKARVLLNL